MPPTRRALLACCAIAAGAVARRALAQAVAARPVRIVVPFPPGGAADMQVRLIAGPMARALGRPVVADNKPGGSTLIATRFVAQAPADGSTLLLVANSFVINAKLHAGTLPYEGLQAFQPVACLTRSPQLLAVSAGSPYRTFRAWLAAARARPGTVSYAAVGPASTQHIAMEMLQHAAGIRLVYTPFAGGASAVNAVLGGDVDVVLANVSELQPLIEAGTMRALAVTTPQRLDRFAQVPTVAESGLPGYQAVAWFGLCAPAGTPRDAVARLAAAATGAVNDPALRHRLLVMGLAPAPMGPAEFAAHIADQYARYAKAIDQAGIRA